MPITAVDLREIDKHAANVYEAIIVAGKKSRTINDEQKLEFQNAIVSVATANADDDAEDFHNPDQMRISLEFEKRPKPHLQALNLLLEGKLKFEYREKEPKKLFQP
ncbi:MAG: DNA-directed RNA polymerase subunit omega [Ignavibacteriales bacterium]|nr:DNA-directed RNA polymerase subunit omega [Ignavibacteriales bacterium]